jgi:hypothetical protein
MKTAAGVLVLAGLTAVVLAASGCNYTKPIVYIDIVNRSGHPVENLEVTHPAGSFGMPELRNEQTHRRMIPAGTPCKFSIAFEDQAGRKYAEDYDLGAKCPTETALEIGDGMKVSERLLRP